MGDCPRVRWRGNSESSSRLKDTPNDATESSNSTAPTDLSPSSSPSKNTLMRHRSPYPTKHMLASSGTLGSSASSQSSCCESRDEIPDPRAQAASQDQLDPHVLPATSRDFAELFPSSRKLLIHHDDTTLDGNMNLRIDTLVTTPRGLPKEMTLFHLRMYNLKCRDFSLRRYSRGSGREICHCVRKSHKSMLGARPNIQRSLSNAFAAMKPRSEAKQQQQSRLLRQDSGYETMHSDEENEEGRPQSSHSNKAPAKDATDLISLEFSNYAHIDLKRRGFKADKRYDFEYWGTSYSWRRSTQKMGRVREVSYHLTRRDGSLVARIVPETLSTEETAREEDRGGWIPPCSLRILDQQISDEGRCDVADIVVSTGLIVLTDDCIRRHFHHEEHRGKGFHLPTIPTINSRTGAKAKASFAASVDGIQDKIHRKLIPHSLQHA